jgi:predicted SAM-dependent methyltransferase
MIGPLALLLRSLRARPSAPAAATAAPIVHDKLHLGCGTHLLEGWANIDLDGPSGVIRHDLTRPLPMRADSADLVFCEHFIEHLTRAQGLALLQECRRVLKPGGTLRLSTPDLRKLIDEYLAGRTTAWAQLGWQPLTPCRMLNEGLRLWGHLFVYDRAELLGLLAEAGFREIEAKTWRESAHPALRGLESRPFVGELIYEARK